MEGLSSSILSLIALDLPVYDLWKFCCVNKRMHAACDNVYFRIAYIRRHPRYFIPDIFISAEDHHLISYDIFVKWIRAGLHDASNWDPSAIDNYMLLDACSQGYIEVVRLLLADSTGRVLHGSPTTDIYQCLRFALNGRHLEVVHLLLNDPRVIVLDQQYNALIQMAENYEYINTAERLKKRRLNLK